MVAWVFQWHNFAMRTFFVGSDDCDGGQKEAPPSQSRPTPSIFSHVLAQRRRIFPRIQLGQPRLFYLWMIIFDLISFELLDKTGTVLLNSKMVNQFSTMTFPWFNSDSSIRIPCHRPPWPTSILEMMILMKQIIFYKGESNPILTPECFSKSKRSWVKAKRVQDSSQIPKPFGINFQTPYRKHNIHRESRGFGFFPIPTRAAPAGYPARLTIRVLCFLFLIVVYMSNQKLKSK